MPDDEKKKNSGVGASQRPKLLWVISLLALFVVTILLSKSCTKESPGHLSDADNRAALFVKPGGPPTVVQVRDTMKPARFENRAYVLSLDQEVFVDVLSPAAWLRQRLSELGTADLD